MIRQHFLIRILLLLSLGALGLQAPNAARGQNPSAAPEKASGVIKTESNLVLVDVVATDKKGNYIRDLEKKDFHLYDDDAEQAISSFAREPEAQPGGPV